MKQADGRCAASTYKRMAKKYIKAIDIKTECPYFLPERSDILSGK
jgi:hypothetical protein